MDHFILALLLGKAYEISTSILHCIHIRSTSTLCWNDIGFERWDWRWYVVVESPSVSMIFRHWFYVLLTRWIDVENDVYILLKW